MLKHTSQGVANALCVIILSQNAVIVLFSYWTLPVFFMTENPALRHRLRTREKLHLQAVGMIPQAKHEKQAEIQITFLPFPNLLPCRRSRFFPF